MPHDDAVLVSQPRSATATSTATRRGTRGHLAADRQHAAASRVSVRALHRERRRRGRHRIGARFHGHPGDFDDQLDRARCRAPLDLTSVPLPTRLRTPASRPGSTTYRLFDPRRHRYGAPDRRIHHEERDAADNRDRLTVSSASARRAEANSPESRTRNDGTAKRPVDSHTGIG